MSNVTTLLEQDRSELRMQEKELLEAEEELTEAKHELKAVDPKDAVALKAAQTLVNDKKKGSYGSKKRSSSIPRTSKKRLCRRVGYCYCL